MTSPPCVVRDSDGACPRRRDWSIHRTCSKPMNCERFGCLEALNEGRRAAHVANSGPLPLLDHGTTIADARAKLLEEQVSWIAHLIHFMDVKLCGDPDYEILRSLVRTIDLDRGCRNTHPGHVFNLVHFNRWCEKIGNDEALAAARNGTLAELGPKADQPKRIP